MVDKNKAFSQLFVLFLIAFVLPLTLRIQTSSTMKKLYIILLILFSMTMCTSTPQGQKFKIETSLGNIYIVLYDDTPLHRDNFIKLVEQNYYNDLTFHRVIKGFMVQAGDAKSAGDSTTSKFDKENVIAPEFRFPTHSHKAGALAAARWGDEENPEKLSDAFQFYIVSGKSVFDHDLRTLEKERFERLKQNIYSRMQKEAMDTIKAMYKEGNRTGIKELRAAILENAEKEAEERKAETIFPDEVRKVYTEIGGTPHLDGEYTVFGEVYDGLDVVKKIETVETNSKDKPLQPIVISKITAIN